MSQKLKNEIFVDLNRAGHDKSVEKTISGLAQIFTKLWSIYELHVHQCYTIGDLCDSGSVHLYGFPGSTTH